jgi:hypothetical protein
METQRESRKKNPLNRTLCNGVCVTACLFLKKIVPIHEIHTTYPY